MSGRVRPPIVARRLTHEGISMSVRPTPRDDVAIFPVSDRDRRRHDRHPGRAVVEVIRVNDPLRKGLRVEMVDVSLSGVGFSCRESLQQGERVTIRVQNVVQRFRKEMRGVVRWNLCLGDGTARVGVELQSSFSALDMQMLKRAGLDVASSVGRVWV